jgi:hypothetical protein
VQQLPPQVIQAISQMVPQELYGAIKMLFGQIPPELQAQVGQMIQGVPPEQVIQLFHDAAVQVISAAGGGQQAQQPVQPQLPNQPTSSQTITQPAMREMLNAAQIGM